NAQRELAMLNISDDIAHYNDQILKQQEIIQRLLNLRDRFGNSQKIEEQLTVERAKLEELGRELAQAVEIRTEYQSILDRNTDGANRNASATAKLTDRQKELIAALRNELAMLDMTEREAYIFQTTLRLGED